VQLVPVGSPEQAAAGEAPAAACDRTIVSLRAKANSNQRLARWGAGLIIASTAAVPVVLLASTQWGGFTLGKLVPAILAALAAAAAGFLQIERPHERWKLYRGYQRLLEAERLKFENGVDPYADPSQRNQLLAQRLSERQLQLHADWADLVPRSTEVATSHRPPLS
jgi:hypothetical protein